jgi:hypothetical protein
MEDARGMMCVAAEVVVDAVEAVVVVGMVVKCHSLNSNRMQIREIWKICQTLPPREISVEETPVHILVAAVTAVDEVDPLSRCCRR